MNNEGLLLWRSYHKWKMSVTISGASSFAGSGQTGHLFKTHLQAGSPVDAEMRNLSQDNSNQVEPAITKRGTECHSERTKIKHKE